MVSVSVFDYRLRNFAPGFILLAFATSSYRADRIRAYHKRIPCSFRRRHALLDNGNLIYHCWIWFVVDHFRWHAFEMEAFSSNDFRTFCRLVQQKMGPDCTLNRTCNYDTVVGGGNMVLAINSAGINYGASPPGGL